MEVEIIKLTLEETLLFYSSPDKERNREIGCIGHLRGDFGHRGKEFWHTWWEHQNELNTPEFKTDLAAVMERLRQDLLKDYNSMEKFCHQYRAARMEGVVYPELYGFRVSTEHYRYYIRCSLEVNEYFYIYCYKNQKERLHEKTEDRQMQPAPIAPKKKKHEPER